MLKINRILQNFYSTQVRPAVDKTSLSKLRKKTGYTFSNCHKALEVCNNDLKEAEKWIKEQALALGWATAHKVAGRATLQGLVAISVDTQSAAMLEVNCETDFVAKNDLFKQFVAVLASSCLSAAREFNQFENSIARAYLSSDQLKTLPGLEGRTLEEERTLLVSQIGENVSLRRAVCLHVENDLRICGSTHPVIDCNDVQLGRYGSLLVYKCKSIDENIPHVTKELCQHIIGKNPESLGKMDEWELLKAEKERIAEETKPPEAEECSTVETEPEVEKAESNNQEISGMQDLISEQDDEEEVIQRPKENKDEEKRMIFQEFLKDPEITVADVLKENDITVIEFSRYERGEDLD